MSADAARGSIGTWVLAVGATGFAAGFIGPVLLNPEANQGPLLGIFITGPGGVLAGLLLGVLVRVLPVSPAASHRLLVMVCAAVLVTTLWFCLPGPAVLGYVIDGEITGCESSTRSADAALAHWRQALAHTPWANPPANWEQSALQNLASARGVVVTVQVQRRVPILVHRRLWDRGRRSAGSWLEAGTGARYYTDYRGAQCADYLNQGHHLYWPHSDSSSAADQPARVWPPTDPGGFLSLQQLGPVPAEYRRLLP